MLGVILTGITIGAVYGLLALGIVLVYKATGVLNIAQGEVGTFATYGAFVVSAPFGETLGALPFGIPIKGWGLPVAVGAVIGIAFGGAIGIAMERVAIRPAQDAPKVIQTVITLGVTTVLLGLGFALFTEQPRNLPALLAGGVTVSGSFLTMGHFLAIVLTGGLGIAFFLFFRRTLFGLGVLASSQNATSLRLMGVPLNRISMFTWGLGGALAGLAGVILGPMGVLHPGFMTLLLIPSLTAALVGGLTSLPGAFVGGIVVGTVQSFVTQYGASDIPGLEFAAYFALIVGVLLLRPRGLLGAEA